MPAIFFALISYFGWAFGDIFGTITTRKIGAYSSNLWASLINLIIFALYIPFAPGSLKDFTTPILILNFALGFLLWVSIITFSLALIISNAALVGTISASFVVVTVILSILFLGESISFVQAISILIIFLGIVLSTLNLNELVKRKLKLDRGIYLSIFTMFAWGIYFAFIKLPIKEVSWFWPSVVTFSLFPIYTIVYTKIKKIKILPPTYNNALFPQIMGVILVRAAELNYNFSVSKGLVAIVAPIAGSYPTLFVLLAFIFFKDKITKQQILGIITTLIGIVLLSFFSV